MIQKGIQIGSEEEISKLRFKFLVPDLEIDPSLIYMYDGATLKLFPHLFPFSLMFGLPQLYSFLANKRNDGVFFREMLAVSFLGLCSIPLLQILLFMFFEGSKFLKVNGGVVLKCAGYAF